jgi:sugar phosphate isomerase/epimerase
VTICLEPNPARYQCNFMTDTAATARIVEQVAHAAIRLQLDTGAMVINQEDPLATVTRHAHLVGHIHASEPDLIPLGDAETDHAQIARALSGALPRHIVSIEMLTPKNTSPLPAIERAFGVAVRNYRAREQGQGDSL